MIRKDEGSGNVVEFKRPIAKKLEQECSVEHTRDSKITLGTTLVSKKGETVTLSVEARARHTMLIGASGADSTKSTY